MTGSKIAHYEIGEKLGEGGMGVVYKARDTKLDRSVALKVLPADKLGNPDRRRRFVQEAKAASALNHPNIVTVHDIATEDGTDFIVMEFVDGKTLDRVIQRRGMRVGESLDIAVQIADALESAHGAGIVHRDLKPGNIMVADSGRVKVLDFGLAKLVEPSAVSVDEVTRTALRGDDSPRTDEGTILGTSSYMSPEQAQGLPVDSRSDIFSFGAVLYEMVTGSRAFRGDSQMSTLAAVINKEPEPPSGLAEDLPREVERIVERCLRKDPKRRFQHMDDLRIALDDLKAESASGRLSAVSSEKAPGRRSVLVPVLSVALVLSAVAVAWLWTRDDATGIATVRDLRPVPLTNYPGTEMFPTFSPDGDRVAFEWCRESDCDIYLRLIGSETRQQLTSGPVSDRAPAWSPDGTQIAFVRELQDEDSIALMPSIGGPVRVLARLPAGAQFWTRYGPRITWHPSGQWLIASAGVNPAELHAVDVRTGETRRLLTAPSEILGDSCPAFSPDGRSLLFCRVRHWASSGLYQLHLDADLQPESEPAAVTQDSRLSSPVWLPGGQAVVLNIGKSRPTPSILEMRSGANPVGLGLDRNTLALAFSESSNRLVYPVLKQTADVWGGSLKAPGRPSGDPVSLISSTVLDHQAKLSPDGSQVVFISNRTGVPEVWIGDADGSNSVRLTDLGGAGLSLPNWSPDGKQVLFGTVVDGNSDLYAIEVEGGRMRRVTEHPALENEGVWSPDMQTIYFSSNRSGRPECYSMPVGGGEPVQLTSNGALSCRISPDGETLYHLSGGDLRTVALVGGESERVVPRVVDLPGDGSFTVVADGLYFMQQVAEGRWSIHYLDNKSGDTRLVLEIEAESIYCLSADSDGTRLIWSDRKEFGADLMLVENFR